MPKVPSAVPSQSWITLAEARAITGHPTTGALDAFIRRHNAKFPASQIRRRPGYIEQGSLLRALDALAEVRTPGAALARAHRERAESRLTK